MNLTIYQECPMVHTASFTNPAQLTGDVAFAKVGMSDLRFTASLRVCVKAATGLCMQIRKGISSRTVSLAFHVAMVLYFLGSPLWASAETGESKLLVSATVLKHASMQILTQPSAVVVTAADIARGYIDVSNSAKLAVQSNTQGGYMVMFESQGEFLRQTLVKGLDNDVQLSAYGGGVAQRASGRGMHKTMLDLGFRFILSESARQGVYAWPLRLSVTPL